MHIWQVVVLAFCFALASEAVELDYCGGQHPSCITDADCAGLPCPYCNMKKKVCGLRALGDYCGGLHPLCSSDADCAGLPCPNCNLDAGRCGV